MAHEFLQGVSPRIVRQLAAMDSVRRVWIARLPAQRNGYRMVAAPTRRIPQFWSARVAGLVCAETPAGRDRIAAGVCLAEPLLWSEVPIGKARKIARRLAEESDSVVHLALYDDPERIVWEPTAGRLV